MIGEQQSSTHPWAGVRGRVAALRSHPGVGKVFGANGHGFTLEPPLSPADLADLETCLGVELPAEYRTFLTDVGAGGAGPAYGVFPVRREPDGTWRWHGDGADMVRVDLLATPFPVDRVPGHVLAELEKARPDEEDYDDLDDFDTAMEQWDDRLEAVLWRDELTAGAICLVHEGCAQRCWLVVTGPARGTMWQDCRTDDVDLYPMTSRDGSTPLTFANWYLGWLADAERTVRG